MTDRTITITTEDGKEHVCDILFTYYSEEFNKNYVLFIPRGLEQISAAVYSEQEAGQGSLTPVETEAEWDMLEELLDDYYQQEDTGGCSGQCGSCGSCGGEGCDCDGCSE